ncbi:MAG: hypothetical protein ACXADY_10815 [Candidatus Hodarchaeales archaeon]|jgi:hypothetical protein
MSESEIDAIYQLIVRNPPIFVIIGGILSILLGELIDTELLIFSGWSSLITGVFFQIGWSVMIYYQRR